MIISWHSKAVEDLNENIKYIAIKSPQNAIHVLKALTELCDSLGNMSFKYPIEPVYNSESVRFVTKWSFKIIYRIEAERVYILRIFNTHQNPIKVFD